MAMVHRVRRELSSCASFSAESQHRPRPPEMARHPHRPRTQQPGDACRPPSACSSAAPGALGLSREEAQSLVLPASPPLAFQPGEALAPGPLPSHSRLEPPGGKAASLWGSVSLELPLLVKPWEGTVPERGAGPLRLRSPRPSSPPPRSHCRDPRARTGPLIVSLPWSPPTRDIPAFEQRVMETEIPSCVNRCLPSSWGSL